MREQLIDGNDGLVFQVSQSENTCVYSGRTIPKGQHAVTIRMKVNDNSYLAWISPGSIDGLVASFTEFTAEEESVPNPLSPTEYVKYNRVKGEQISCCVCDTHIPKGSEGISYHNPSGYVSQTVWTHTDCLTEVISGLENTWQYADEILAEQV